MTQTSLPHCSPSCQDSVGRIETKNNTIPLWPLFPFKDYYFDGEEEPVYTRPNIYIYRSDGALRPGQKQVFYDGQEKPVLYYRPTKAQLLLMETLFPGQSFNPPWSTIYGLLVWDADYHRIWNLRAYDALTLVYSVIGQKKGKLKARKGECPAGCEREQNRRSAARKRRMTLDEANLRAITILRRRKQPPGKDRWTVRTLRKAIGCSIGLIPRLPAWRAYRKYLENKREKRKSVRTVPLTEIVLDQYRNLDPALQSLIEEQEKDAKSKYCYFGT
mgnify:CR=1 FL=1